MDKLQVDKTVPYRQDKDITRRISSLRKPTAHKKVKQLNKNSKEAVEFTLKDDAHVKEYDLVKNLLDPIKWEQRLYNVLEPVK